MVHCTMAVFQLVNSIDSLHSLRDMPLRNQRQQPCHDQEVAFLTLLMSFVLAQIARLALLVNIVCTCPCRDYVVRPTLANQVYFLARYALHAMACARLPGSTRLKTTQVAALAALKNRIVCGTTTPALFCSTTLALSGLARWKVFRALPFSMVYLPTLLFAVKGSVPLSLDCWTNALRP